MSIVKLYLHCLQLLLIILITVQDHHHRYVTTSLWINHRAPNVFLINSKEMNKTSIAFDHHVPNSFLVISAVVAIIYAHLHVNVSFHQIQFKINTFRRYLLDRMVRVHRRTIHRITAVKDFESLFDFILSTDHLRRSIFERYYIEISTRQLFYPKLSSFIALLVHLFPLTFATKLPSTTQFDLLLTTNSTYTFSFYPTLPKPQWHAGCCIQPNLNMCDSTLSSSKSVYTSNNTSLDPFVFNDNSQFTDRYQLYDTNSPLNTYDFLNNKTAFCQHYDEFRRLSANPLAIFTYSVVIIGIIFNSFVFLVLLRGSLRRSTSFTLFVALTSFDLLSLASSLFALLFRTVLTSLKSSALFCKMFGIFFLYFRQCSSTTLLLIAIERCTVIKYPFFRYAFDKFRLWFLAFIMLGYVVPIPFDFIFYTSGELHCEAFDTLHAHRYQIFRGFFTVFSYAMIPFVGIAISNLLIIIELKKSKERFPIKDEDGKMRNISTK